MKSAFGSKRKARKIQVEEEEDGEGLVVNNVAKPFKKSSLRQSIVLDDLQQETDDTTKSASNYDASTNVPNLATIGRSNYTMKKKKKAASRLSFGPGEIISGDAAEALEDDETFTLKKSTLGRRVIDSSALRKSTPYGGDDDEQRPTYSKDYLNELKSSTPTTRPAAAASIEDEADLGLEELDGAMVVDSDMFTTAYIPSEAEIKEKKERRARLAKDQDFISLDDDDGDSGRTLSLLPRKKVAETRLVREDEDLGEGFDEFVEDGRIALGKKQERAAKKAHRKAMAEQIRHAEGSSDEDSDDSESERRAAYEAAQTRAGMDGLHKPTDDVESTAQIPSKITPLPVLSECLERLKTTLQDMEQDMVSRQKRVADLEQEKREILAREVEVQELLKQAGERYATLTVDAHGAVDPKAIVDAQNRSPMVADRGLESFGNTPTIRPELHDVN
jgi:hypothetical protein